jgi:hypothetical protein
MKLFGIFNKNNNYQLLRYSTYLQDECTYEKYNKDTNKFDIINEICFPDIEYSVENIGQFYDINQKTFVL